MKKRKWVNHWRHARDGDLTGHLCPRCGDDLRVVIGGSPPRRIAACHCGYETTLRCLTIAETETEVTP